MYREDDEHIPFGQLSPEIRSAQLEAWLSQSAFEMSTSELQEASTNLIASPKEEHQDRAKQFATEVNLRLGYFEPDFYEE